GGTSQWPATIFRGKDQWGENFGYILVDPIGGAIGAFSTGDGISTGGQSRTPICKLPNIEHTEQTFPVLFLYRKELVDSGGAGLHRGGMSAETCFIPHNTPTITHDTLSSGNAVPTSTGMMGGYPATVNIYKFRKNTDILDRFKAANLPSDISEVPGEEVTLALRQQNFQQDPADVYSVVWTGGGGFGDPLRRDPAKVAEDVNDSRAVSVEAAKNIYGVLLQPNGEVDTAKTNALRTSMFNQRKTYPVNGKSDHKALRLGGKIFKEVTENLCLQYAEAGKTTKTTIRWSCRHCQTDLGPASENYKLGCARHDAPIAASNPNIGDWTRYVDDEPFFRQFFCPGCGSLIENEVARDGDPLLQDVHIKV
ncbi:MAG: hydantoinase B/oxoprolinase family protein, partial [Burkholderiaceae bacterium]